MGFGTVAANIILFIAVITLASGFVVYINMYAQETTTALVIQKNRLSDELRTDITITSVFYEESTNVLTTYVQNSGKTDLILNQTDIFISGIRISRTNRTIIIEEDTLVSAVPLWSPKEVIKIVVDYELEAGVNKIKVVTGNGVSDEDIISV